MGITSLEDKIVQQAVVWIMASIDEEDFLDLAMDFGLTKNNTEP